MGSGGEDSLGGELRSDGQLNAEQNVETGTIEQKALHASSDGKNGGIGQASDPEMHQENEHKLRGKSKTEDVNNGATAALGMEKKFPGPSEEKETPLNANELSNSIPKQESRSLVPPNNGNSEEQIIPGKQQDEHRGTSAMAGPEADILNHQPQSFASERSRTDRRSSYSQEPHATDGAADNNHIKPREEQLSTDKEEDGHSQNYGGRASKYNTSPNRARFQSNHSHKSDIDHRRKRSHSRGSRSRRRMSRSLGSESSSDTVHRKRQSKRKPGRLQGRRRSSGERRYRNKYPEIIRNQQQRGSDTYSSDGSPCERYSTPRRSRDANRPPSSDNHDTFINQRSQKPKRFYKEKNKSGRDPDKIRTTGQKKSKSPERKSSSRPLEPETENKFNVEDSRILPTNHLFSDDVSEWGKTDKPDLYDSDKAPSTQTMTSGLSPRYKVPKTMEWDSDAAKRALSYNAGLYGASQTMRRQGQVGGGIATISYDLPSRLAYQHLSSLAGMAGKVQSAILHNKKIFEQRLLMNELAVKQRGLDAWKTHLENKNTTKRIMLRAMGRLQRGSLARSFFAWKDKFHLVDKHLTMMRKALATSTRGILRRSIKEWHALCIEYAWKDHVKMCEREIKALERKICGYERRPIVVLKYRKLKACIKSWALQSFLDSEKKRRSAQALSHLTHRLASKAWNTWVLVQKEKKRRLTLIKRVLARIQNACTANAFSAWQFVLGTRELKKRVAQKALSHWQKRHLAQAWHPLIENAKRRKQIRQICSRWKHPLMARGVSGWIDRVSRQKRMRLIAARAGHRLMCNLRRRVMEAWTEALCDSKLENEMRETQNVMDRNCELTHENARLRRDNERFVRLIDSGEWGRHRVEELSRAGEILKSERDALMELVKSLRREYEAVEMAKHAQDGELQDLKDRLVLGGAATAAGRNKMLVRGASSFNALVRAMKQDLVDKGAGKDDPKLMYEVEKLSLDKVHVFSDGELKVEAVAPSEQQTSSSPARKSSSRDSRSKRRA